jgi:sugar lactone lactonase YvrE
MPTRLSAELVLDAGAVLGECPVWDAGGRTLVWLDLLGQRLHRFDPRSGADTAVALPERVGAVAPRGRGGWVAATPQGFAALGDDGALTTLVEVEADRPGNRMNDGRCDAAGRFWAGTMAEDHTPGAGALYRLDADHTVSRVVEGIGISNGIDWSPDGAAMYLVDSLTRSLSVFDFDAARGEVERRRTLLTVAGGEGVPDGLCVDVEGFIWLALPRSGRVRRHAPDGRVDTEVSLPARLVTSVAFGGDDLRELYMTTGLRGLDAAELAAQPGAGGLFRVRPGAGGHPVHAWAG